MLPAAPEKQDSKPVKPSKPGKEGNSPSKPKIPDAPKTAPKEDHVSEPEPAFDVNDLQLHRAF